MQRTAGFAGLGGPVRAHIAPDGSHLHLILPTSGGSAVAQADNIWHEVIPISATIAIRLNPDRSSARSNGPVVISHNKSSRVTPSINATIATIVVVSKNPVMIAKTATMTIALRRSRSGDGLTDAVLELIPLGQ